MVAWSKLQGDSKHSIALVLCLKNFVAAVICNHESHLAKSDVALVLFGIITKDCYS